MQAMFGSMDNPAYRNALIETISLIGYTNPLESPVSYLLDPAIREIVVSLNELILSG